MKATCSSACCDLQPFLRRLARHWFLKDFYWLQGEPSPPIKANNTGNDFISVTHLAGLNEDGGLMKLWQHDKIGIDGGACFWRRASRYHGMMANRKSIALKYKTSLFLRMTRGVLWRKWFYYGLFTFKLDGFPKPLSAILSGPSIDAGPFTILLDRFSTVL